jgi:amidase
VRQIVAPKEKVAPLLSKICTTCVRLISRQNVSARVRMSRGTALRFSAMSVRESFGEVMESSALEQARLIREGQISSEELVRSYLDRIARLNPRFVAFVDVFRRRALVAARWKDLQRRRARGPLPPFHGIPIGVKDLNVIRGTKTRFGSRAVPHLVLPFDDRTVGALRRGGFVFVGKLSTSEMGAMPVTEPDIHPPTRNPWAPSRSSGGSSGGSGAAVAAGMLPLAQGSDGAGSIRIPAAFCHLFGLKPSRGRLPNQFGLPDRHILYTSGPITRTVDDAAAMLDVLAGIDHGRPHWAPAPERPFRELAVRSPRRLRVRFVLRTPFVDTHPEIASAVESAARRLAAHGHDVEEGQAPEGTLEEFLPLWQHLIAQMPFFRLRRAQPITRWLIEPGRALKGRDVAALQMALEARMRPVLDAADLWVTPTVGQPAPLVGAFRDRPPADGFAAAAAIGGFTAVFNLTGQPAASVPLGLTSDGLPMGLQLAGRLFAEGEVLAVARQLEAEMPWQHRRPPGLD